MSVLKLNLEASFTHMLVIVLMLFTQQPLNPPNCQTGCLVPLAALDHEESGGHFQV